MIDTMTSCERGADLSILKQELEDIKAKNLELTLELEMLRAKSDPHRMYGRGPPCSSLGHGKTHAEAQSQSLEEFFKEVGSRFKSNEEFKKWVEEGLYLVDHP